jgi:hypothetical protein
MAPVVKQSLWTHGVVAQLEDHTWVADRRGYSATVYPADTSNGLFGWVHIPVPTPINRGDPFTAVNGYVRFGTTGGCKLMSFHVYDGENPVVKFDNLNYQNGIETVQMKLPGDQVQWGMEISLGVSFDKAGGAEYIEVVGAGIDFA